MFNVSTTDLWNWEAFAVESRAICRFQPQWNVTLDENLAHYSNRIYNTDCLMCRRESIKYPLCSREGGGEGEKIVSIVLHFGGFTSQGSTCLE